MTDSKKEKILIISHDSSLTGAPILLLNLLFLLKKRFDFNMRILLCRGGVLQDEFKKYGRVTILKSKNYSKQSFFFLRGINFLIFKIKLFFFKAGLKKTDLILNNTIANGGFLKVLSASGAKVVTYIHELESVIQVFSKEAKSTFNYSNIYMCPSMAIADNLFENHGIPRDKIFLINSYFPLSKQLKDGISKTYARENFNKNFQFFENKFYVIGMGSGTYRKGVDLFVDAARITKEINKDIHFVWIGDFGDIKMRTKILNEISLHRLQDVITLVDPMPHSLENLLPFDLFILSSREDPYPLVVLEAALMKIPSVCFANTGGAQEFVGDDCGWITDEISSQKLSEKIIEIETQKEEVKKRGENAFIKCVNLHTDENLIESQFSRVLKKI